MATVLTRFDIKPKGDKRARPGDDVLAIAEQRFGYKATEPAPAPDQMLDLLLKAGVRPFDSDRVAEYEAKQSCDKAFRPLWQTLPYCLGVVLVSALLGIFVLAGLLLIMIVPAIVFIVAALCCRDNYDGYKWTRTKLQDYKEPVPLYALQTAISVQIAADEMGIPSEKAWFAVESITLLPKSDPFLVLVFSVGGVSHLAYLEVWDEPGFFKQRTV